MVLDSIRTLDMVRVRLRNSDGTPVDPVPFLVVSLLGITLLLGWGPPYLLEWGVPVGPSIAVSIILAAGVTIDAYRRYVLTARPGLRGEVPAAVRVRRFLYTSVAGVAILSGLTLGVMVIP